MKTVARIASLGGVVLAAATLSVSPALAATPVPSEHPTAHHSAGVVFVQTDNTSGNAVVVYDRGPNGRLTPAGRYRTGGLGGILTGSMVDHLASQGSLTYDPRHQLLYAVNAGSNTVTVFAVDGDHLHRTQVVASGGAFPVSIAVHGDLVYVLNALGGGSIQGFRRIGDHLLKVPSWRRSLGLDPAATPQFTHTPGQIAFTPGGSKLLVTTKANGNSIEVFAIGRRGAPAAKPVVNVLPGAVPFAVTFDVRGRLVVAEAGSSAVATFGIAPDGRIHNAHEALTGQAATCWVVRAGTRLYASNAGSGTLTGYRDGWHGPLAPLPNTPTDPGTVDAAVSWGGQFLYVQTGAKGIVDEFRVGADGSLTRIGSVTVSGGVGGEGIVAL